MTLDELLEIEELSAELKKTEHWRFFVPVPKQQEFFAAGSDYHERLLMAGNGNGKTECAAYEMSRHMTGEYPAWWKGFRIKKPPTMWVTGASAVAVRDAAQTKLCGRPGNIEEFGSGMIPKEAFKAQPKASRSAPDAFESWSTKCVINGRLDDSAFSRVVVKTYEQDREDWQGPDIDVIWYDEEPDMAHYTEGQARLRGRGNSLMTFTPLLGMSEVVVRFMEEEAAGRYMVRMGIKDALFYSDEERARQIASYPANEREARANGDPLLGSGKVFGTPIEDLLIPQIPFAKVPQHWLKIWGLDFGGGSEDAHPFAAVLLAWDREGAAAARSDEEPVKVEGPVGAVYVLHEIRMTNSLILQHCDAIKRVAPQVPVAWPHDGHQKERSSGESMAQLYKKQGLRMLESHATHAGVGGFSTYAGIMDMDQYMQARQWKVADTCRLWAQEYGQYHYDKGVLVKLRDDLMSATRIAHMMRRRAKAVPLGPGAAKTPLRNRPRPVISPWTGHRDYTRTEI